MSSFEWKVWASFALVLCSLISGCGTPGAPQPPSLNLPDAVEDLAAARTGNTVTLTWTNPRRNTDRTTIRQEIKARVCRREGSGACIVIGQDYAVDPGKSGGHVDTLEGALASGAPRPVSYTVELLNRKGRSAGVSNAASVLAGEAPQQIKGLEAEVRKEGVVLTWTANGEETAVRLNRKLLSPPAKNTHQSALAPPPEPVEQKLLVDTAAKQSRAIDKTVRFGETYEYRAQRVSRVELDGKTLELVGEISAPVDVEVKDVFPPEVPGGLAAVATAGENGQGSAIDLSWLPNTEADLAGYVVYRREGEGEWQRISPTAPSITPAFHDAGVQPGHTYQYVVSAIDKGGHESQRSAEVEETVPQN
jgi:hypothetical protein